MTHYADDPYGLYDRRTSAGQRRRGDQRWNHADITALATLGPDGAADYAFAITWEINGAPLPALAAVEEFHPRPHGIDRHRAPGQGSRPPLSLPEAAREHATISYDPNCRPGISPDAAAARRQAEHLWLPATSSKPAMKT